MSDLEKRLQDKLERRKTAHDDLIDMRQPEELSAEPIDVPPQPEPTENNRRRKKVKFTDLYTSQTFYVRNDLWERISALIVERGDRTDIVNEAFEDFLRKRDQT